MKTSFLQLSLIVPLILVPCSVASSQDVKDKSDEVRAAVLGAYAALNAGDADALMQYVGPGGYTEYGEDGGPLFKIDEEHIRRLFGAGIKGDFEVQELEVKVFKEMAVATGYRFGRFMIPNEPTQKSRLRLSTVWYLQDGKWKVAHVHLSPANH